MPRFCLQRGQHRAGYRGLWFQLCRDEPATATSVVALHPRRTHDGQNLRRHDTVDQAGGRCRRKRFTAPSPTCRGQTGLEPSCAAEDSQRQRKPGRLPSIRAPGRARVRGVSILDVGSDLPDIFLCRREQRSAAESGRRLGTPLAVWDCEIRAAAGGYNVMTTPICLDNFNLRMLAANAEHFSLAARLL